MKHKIGIFELFRDMLRSSEDDEYISECEMDTLLSPQTRRRLESLNWITPWPILDSVSCPMCDNDCVPSVRNEKQEWSNEAREYFAVCREYQQRFSVSESMIHTWRVAKNRLFRAIAEGVGIRNHEHVSNDKKIVLLGNITGIWGVASVYVSILARSEDHSISQETCVMLSWVKCSYAKNELPIDLGILDWDVIIESGNFLSLGEIVRNTLARNIPLADTEKSEYFEGNRLKNPKTGQSVRVGGDQAVLCRYFFGRIPIRTEDEIENIGIEVFDIKSLVSKVNGKAKNIGFKHLFRQENGNIIVSLE